MNEQTARQASNDGCYARQEGCYRHLHPMFWIPCRVHLGGGSGGANVHSCDLVKPVANDNAHRVKDLVDGMCAVIGG